MLFVGYYVLKIKRSQAGKFGLSLYTNGGQLTVRNTIIANNGGGDCGVLANDADATNLDGDGTCGDAVQST